MRQQLHGLSDDEARAVIRQNGWQASRITRQLTEPRIVDHKDASFEVRRDGVRSFFYYDNNPGRRSISGKHDKPSAQAMAEAYFASEF